MRERKKGKERNDSVGEALRTRIAEAERDQEEMQRKAEGTKT